MHDLKALSRRWFEQVWNARNDQAIDELAWPNVVAHGLSGDGKPSEGIELFRKFRDGFLAAFPDIKVVVEDVILEGDKSAVRLSFSATHLGAWMGLGPSHRQIVATALTLIRWQDGRIIEAWNQIDAAGMIRQCTV